MKRKNRWRKEPTKKNKGIISNEMREKIEKTQESMLVPIQEGNIIRFESRRVSSEERLNALMNMAQIIEALKTGHAHVLTQSKNEQP